MYISTQQTEERATFETLEKQKKKKNVKRDSRNIVIWRDSLRLSKCAVVSQFNQIVSFCYYFYFYFFTQVLDFKSIPVKIGDENVVQVVFGEGKEF